MATERVERMGVYVNSKLVAEATDCTVTIDNGAEQQDGFLSADYVSRGNPRTTIQIGTVIPKKGETVDVEDSCINVDDVTLSWIRANKVKSCTGIIKTSETKSDSKSGMLSGQYSFFGGGITVS